MTDTDPAESTPASSEPGPEAVELAHRMFDWARDGSPELAAYVDAGAPAELTDAQGNTLLMLASYHGRATTVAALLERGARTDALNDRGQSPLAGAVFKGEDEVVRLLLEAGADPDVGHPSARAAAVMFGRTDLVPEHPDRQDPRAE